MSKFKAVFWDMDGTLFDNEHLYDDCLDLALAKHQLKLPLKLPPGSSLDQIWDCLQEYNQPVVSYQEWFDEIQKATENMLNAHHIRPGVIEVLEVIRNQSIPQSCVSNSDVHTIQNNFFKTGLSDYFKHIVGRDLVNQGKPKPDPYLKAVELNGLSPKDCIAVEDTEVGVSSAKAAGLTVIAHPNNVTKHLNFHEADFVIDHPTKMKSILGLF